MYIPSLKYFPEIPVQGDMNNEVRSRCLQRMLVGDENQCIMEWPNLYYSGWRSGTMQEEAQDVLIRSFEHLFW